jgi:hypothetical protein
MLDQASKIKLLEIRSLYRPFPRGSGEEVEVDLIIKSGKLSVCLVGPGRASHCCALLVALLHRQPGRQMSRQSRLRLSAYDGGGDRGRDHSNVPRNMIDATLK